MIRFTLACLALALPAFPAVIDFDSLTDGDIITNQYVGVLFSSTAGFVNKVTTQPGYNGTPPSFLCTGPASGGIDCTEETVLDFSTGVSGLTFQGMGINDVSANVALVDIFTGGTFNSTLTLAGNAEGLNPVLVDLTAFSDVTRIRMYNISDGGGIGWDTFTFEPGVTSGVPEPSTCVLLGIGLAMGFCVKRRGIA